MNAAVIIDGLSLGGADAGNYVLTDTSAMATASIHAAFAPPLQPEQVAAGDPEKRIDTLFPVPTSEVLTNPPSIIEEGEPTAPATYPEFDCGLDPNAESRCRIELPPSQE